MVKGKFYELIFIILVLKITIQPPRFQNNQMNMLR